MASLEWNCLLFKHSQWWSLKMVLLKISYLKSLVNAGRHCLGCTALPPTPKARKPLLCFVKRRHYAIGMCVLSATEGLQWELWGEIKFIFSKNKTVALDLQGCPEQSQMPIRSVQKCKESTNLFEKRWIKTGMIYTIQEWTVLEWGGGRHYTISIHSVGGAWEAAKLIHSSSAEVVLVESPQSQKGMRDRALPAQQLYILQGCVCVKMGV